MLNYEIKSHKQKIGLKIALFEEQVDFKKKIHTNLFLGFPFDPKGTLLL